MSAENENENEFNPDDISSFVLPETFLKRLYEFTGSSPSDRGFLLAYVNQEGQVMIVQNAESHVVDLGLRKAVEKYLIDMEEAEGRIDIPGAEE